MPYELLPALLLIILVLIALMIILRFIPIGLWISALAAGVKIGIFDLIGMRLRRVARQKLLTRKLKRRRPV